MGNAAYGRPQDVRSEGPQREGCNANPPLGIGRLAGPHDDADSEERASDQDDEGSCHHDFAAAQLAYRLQSPDLEGSSLRCIVAAGSGRECA